MRMLLKWIVVAKLWNANLIKQIIT